MEKKKLQVRNELKIQEEEGGWELNKLCLHSFEREMKISPNMNFEIKIIKNCTQELGYSNVCGTCRSFPQVFRLVIKTLPPNISPGYVKVRLRQLWAHKLYQVICSKPRGHESWIFNFIFFTFV